MVGGWADIDRNYYIVYSACIFNSHRFDWFFTASFLEW